MKFIYTLLIFIFIPYISNAKVKNDSVRILTEIADSFYNEQKYSKALDYYIKGIKLAQENNDLPSYMACIGYIANIYTYYGDNYSGLSFLIKGYETAVKSKHQNMQSCFLANLVSTCCKLNKLSDAKKYYELLKVTPTTLEVKNWEYYVQYNEARIKAAEKKYKEAIKIHKNTLQFAKDNKLGANKEMYQENEIAILYVKLKNYEEALKLGEICKTRAIKENSTELLINAYKVISDAYMGLGDTIMKEKYYNLYSTKRDSLYNIKEFYSSKHQLTEYQNEQVKDNYNGLKTKSMIIIILILISCSILVIFILKYKKNRKKRKKVNKNIASTDTVNIEESQINIISDKIAQVINNNENVFNPEFNLNTLSDMVDSNKTYVSWIINNKYQKNFSTLLNEKRIAEACKMLEDEVFNKNYTIQSIYEHIGYTNASSFIRQFKKIKGVTPIEYRNRKKS